MLRHLNGSRTDQSDVFEVDREAEVVIGHSGAALVRLDLPNEPPRGSWHARIIPVEGSLRRFVLVDLDSPEGVFVNHQRVKDAILLRPGDILQFGPDGADIEFGIG